MNPFHTHQYENYHVTEILYFGGGRNPHFRVFRACVICGSAQYQDLEPGEILGVVKSNPIPEVKP